MHNYVKKRLKGMDKYFRLKTQIFFFVRLNYVLINLV